MLEKKTLDEWMRELGWVWNAGREQLFKGKLTRSEADSILQNLYTKGDIRRA